MFCFHFIFPDCGKSRQDLDTALSALNPDFRPLGFTINSLSSCSEGVLEDALKASQAAISTILSSIGECWLVTVSSVTLELQDLARRPLSGSWSGPGWTDSSLVSSTPGFLSLRIKQNNVNFLIFLFS